MTHPFTKTISTICALGLLCFAFPTAAILSSDFDYLWAYQGEVAQFEKDGKIGLVNRAGEVLCPPSFDTMGLFTADGTALVTSRGLKGLIDQTGQVVAPPGPYSMLYLEENGSMVIFQQQETHLYGAMDITGAVVIEPTFTYIGSFTDGVAYAEQYESWNLIDTAGRLQREQWLDKVDFRTNIGYLMQDGEELSISMQNVVLRRFKVDADGTRTLLEARTEEGTPITLPQGAPIRWLGGMNNDAYVIVMDEGTSLIDGRGKAILPGLFDAGSNSIRQTSWEDGEGYLVEQGGLCGLYDNEGQQLLPCEWDKLDSCRGHFYAQKGGRAGIIDAEGSVIIPVLYENVMWWKEEGQQEFGYYAQEPGKTGVLLDMEGRTLRQLSVSYENYGAIGGNSKGISIFLSRDADSMPQEWIITDRERGVRARIPYDEISFPDEDSSDFCPVDSYGFIGNIERDGELGFMNPDGEIITNPEWMNVRGFHEDGLTHVYTKERKHGIIDETGAYVIPPIWDSLSEGTNGAFFTNFGTGRYAKVGLEDEQGNMIMGYINEAGQPVSGVKLPAAP